MLDCGNSIVWEVEDLTFNVGRPPPLWAQIQDQVVQFRQESGHPEPKRSRSYYWSSEEDPKFESAKPDVDRSPLTNKSRFNETEQKNSFFTSLRVSLG